MVVYKRYELGDAWMMTSKMTPPVFEYCIGISTHNGAPVAAVWPNFVDEAVTRAHANMICAAPQLLAACLQATYMISEEHTGFLHEAIRKAGGR